MKRTFIYEEYHSQMSFAYYQGFIEYIEERGHQLIESNYDPINKKAYIKAQISMLNIPHRVTDRQIKPSYA